MNSRDQSAAIVETMFQEIIDLGQRFLVSISNDLPTGEDLQCFQLAREEKINNLRPVLNQQNEKFAKEFSEGRSDEGAQAMTEKQLQYMTELKSLDQQITEQIVARREQVGAKMNELLRGKKGLQGYKSGGRCRAKFCRQYA